MKNIVFFTLIFLSPIQAQDDDALIKLFAQELRNLKLEINRLKEENRQLTQQNDELKDKLNGCENKNIKVSEYLNLGFSTIGAIAGGFCALGR
jgi:FtsZ-binding cell division protein ZapB